MKYRVRHKQLTVAKLVRSSLVGERACTIVAHFAAFLASRADEDSWVARDATLGDIPKFGKLDARQNDYLDGSNRLAQRCSPLIKTLAVQVVVGHQFWILNRVKLYIIYDRGRCTHLKASEDKRVRKSRARFNELLD